MDSPQQRLVANMIFLDARDRCLDELGDRGVQLLCLKGSAFLETIYTLQERRMIDIDLLMRVADRDVVHAWAQDRGYHALYPSSRPRSRLHHYNWGYRHHASQVAIEFHTHFAQAERHPMRMEAIFGRSVRHRVGERWIDTPGPEDHLLHLAIHAGKESYFGWEKTAEDARRLIASYPIDWPALVDRAGAARTTTNLYVLLRRVGLLEASMETRGSVPDDVVQALRPPAHRMAVLSLLLDFKTGEARYPHRLPWVRYATLPLAVESKRCLARATLRHASNLVLDAWARRTGGAGSPPPSG